MLKVPTISRLPEVAEVVFCLEASTIFILVEPISSGIVQVQVAAPLDVLAKLLVITDQLTPGVV